MGNDIALGSVMLAAVGVMLFVFKSAVVRYIDHRLTGLESRHKAELAARRSRSEINFQEAQSVYGELAEVIHQCRTLSRDCAADPTDVIQLRKYAAYVHHLYMSLGKYKLFLGDAAYRTVHRFKSECQTVQILLDELSRSTHVKDAPVDPDVRASAGRQLSEKVDLIETLYDRIYDDLRKQIEAATQI